MAEIPTREGLNIKQLRKLSPFIKQEAEQWILIKRLASRANLKHLMKVYSNAMPVILNRTNLTLAYLQVVRNKGSAGIDGMGVKELKAYLNKNWINIRKCIY